MFDAPVMSAVVTRQQQRMADKFLIQQQRLNKSNDSNSDCNIVKFQKLLLQTPPKNKKRQKDDKVIYMVVRFYINNE